MYNYKCPAPNDLLDEISYILPESMYITQGLIPVTAALNVKTFQAHYSSYTCPRDICHCFYLPFKPQFISPISVPCQPGFLTTERGE